VIGQRHAILEGAVHALPMEGHHRVRGIAEQHRAIVQVPAVQVQRGERADGLRSKSCSSLGISGTASAKSRSKNARASCAVRTGCETRVAFAGQEQGDGERALVVGQGNAHVRAARPDVQGSWVRCGSRRRRGRISSSL
jgi:hypothetical protein